MGRQIYARFPATLQQREHFLFHCSSMSPRLANYTISDSENSDKLFFRTVDDEELIVRVSTSTVQCVKIYRRQTRERI